MANKNVSFSDVVRSASGYEYPIDWPHGYGTTTNAWGYDKTHYQTPEEHKAAKNNAKATSASMERILERRRQHELENVAPKKEEVNQEMNINRENNTITFCNGLGVCTAIAITAGLAAKLTGIMGGKTKRNKRNKRNKRKSTRRRR